jgi:hypothetical protein
MSPNHLIGDLQPLLMPALVALDPGFLADTAHPFIAADRRIPRFPGPTTDKPPGIDISSPPEKFAKEGDLRLWV